MSKLIVLSNRVNIPSADHHAAGGLAVALQDALKEIGGVWLGWNGEKVETKDQQHFQTVHIDQVDYITCPLTHKEYQDYYCGFSNNTLWPAMHEREDLIEFDQNEFKTYLSVNQLFALELKKIAQPDDMIWVHDYHFLSVAAYCRQLGMKNRMGFFLHIPFAKQSIWKKLSVADQLIGNLCEYDVIGLQTEYDQQKCMSICQGFVQAQPKNTVDISLEQSKRNFAHTIQDSHIERQKNKCQVLDSADEASENTSSHFLNAQHRMIKIECYPIGVNPELIRKTAEQQNHLSIDDIFEMEHSALQKTIISVDRVDYSKGMLERFDAFADFLKQHPEYHQMITDLQIACPCRMDIPAYETLFKNVQAKVKEINQQYMQGDWSPINCTHDTVGHDQLMKLYRDADICWVNSLKDGMNLVAKEFIAAQNEDDPGVLILSKYAGSAEQMPEAILIDPHHTKSMVDALKKALSMSKVEKQERYRELFKGLKQFDIHHWRNSFLKDLRKIEQLAYSHTLKRQRVAIHSHSL
ncbi:alpha,alpha-trehalose-phosphate synthase (UDP-forming) [Acinetobacter shaoyimingii]|uniref:Trehalose-6-phosphate synthase n=1 Tax=Acinetobacter shaoyimingii TaxID=2715164 RepID=A0A6G8RVD2_9GAMM|nr:trehalose-6-phosphate synthase [Acinetobacter shaoyimingii]QIO05837.1 trehalose-6-phosphate synthase [Acinetobacter shaoyimingii]